MRPRLMLCFWLGSLDSRVAAGQTSVGGTHDIRFCSVGDEVRRFVDSGPNPDGQWQMGIEPYPEAGLRAYQMVIVEYGGRRRGECALPTQFGGSGREYPLWRRVVRPYRSSSTAPREAIVLVKDIADRYHARVIRREHLPELPLFMRNVLEQFDQCGRLIRVPGTYELIDFPVIDSRYDDPPLVIRRAVANQTKQVDRIRRMRGAQGSQPSGVRHRRSRQLAEELKRLYGFRCQLCDGSIPSIHIGGDRYYVEVHHIQGLAEVNQATRSVGPTQDASELLLDRAENIVVVCPHHHMVLHYAHGGVEFDRANQRFIGRDGTILPLLINEHL